MRSTPLYLTVSYRDNEEVKLAGARWDAAAKKWCVRPGTPVDFRALEQWLPLEPIQQCGPDDGVLVNILGLAVQCWRKSCRRWTVAVVGIEVPGQAGFAEAAEGTNLAIASKILADRMPDSVGAIRIRASKTAGRSYLSNGCRHCDALLGAEPQRERIGEAAAGHAGGFVRLGEGYLHPLLLDAAYTYDSVEHLVIGGRNLTVQIH